MAQVRSNGHVRRSLPIKAALVALAAGLMIGVLFAWLWGRLTPPAVPLEDYVVLVSAAFDRERLPLNAVDRLNAAGVRDAAGTVAAVAKEYRPKYPDRTREAANLEQLAAALKGQAVAASAAKTANGTGWPGWLLYPILIAGAAAIAALVATLWCFRPQIRRSYRSLPEAEVPRLDKEQLAGGMRGPLPPTGPEGEVVGAPAEPALGIDAGGSRMRVGGLSTVARRRREVALRPFVFTYHAGEDPFEELRPILHEDGDTLVGACGLTAMAKLETGTPARYYAFTAWVHDYLDGDTVHAVGLLSRWASGQQQRPVLLNKAVTQGSLHRVEKGLTANMETKNLLVSVEVVDLSYGTARDVPANSYFTILSVKFTVTIKA